jgi:hypothetical protein
MSLAFRRWHATVLCSVVGVLLACAADCREGPNTFQLDDLQAKVYYTNTGRFSSNVLTNPVTPLENGEGPEGPFRGTLLLAKVRGPATRAAEGLKLQVTARTKKAVLLDQTVEVGEMNSNGNYYAAFWVNEDSCEPMTVEARLILGEPGPSIKGVIDFFCAE